MGTSLHSCAKLHESIEMPFKVVSGVGRGIGVLDGSQHLARGRGGFEGLSCPLL